MDLDDLIEHHPEADAEMMQPSPKKNEDEWGDLQVQSKQRSNKNTQIKPAKEINREMVDDWGDLDKDSKEEGSDSKQLQSVADPMLESPDKRSLIPQFDKKQEFEEWILSTPAGKTAGKASNLVEGRPTYHLNVARK
mmetsp:Transcript_8672/g.14703  ORF Transcript_8672/g.14703 Transcript_8672/m.14703 type:complete len:137 (-) Transcript_8672:498-908(-)